MAWPGACYLQVRTDRWRVLDAGRTQHVLARAREIYPGAEVAVKEPTVYSCCSANMAIVRVTRGQKQFPDVVICVHCSYAFSASDPGMGG